MYRILPVLIVSLILLSPILGSIPVPPFQQPENLSPVNFSDQPMLTGSYLYTVTFQENGLPAGSFWAVQFGSSYSSGYDTSIVFTSPQGNFTYFIYYGNQSSYALEGTSNIQGNTVITININQFSVNLEGNTSNLTWYAVITKNTGFTCRKESNGSAVDFFVPDGHYNYSVFIHEFGMNVTACTNSTIITANSQVSVLLRSIKFSESGIPVGHEGLSWNTVLQYYVGGGESINMISTIYASSNNSSFTVFYPYSVSLPSYIISVVNDNCSFQVSYGKVNLSVLSVNEDLYFGNITVKAHGISNQTQWGVTVFNETSKVFGFRTTNPSSNLYLLNGTYNYRDYLYSNYSNGKPTFSSPGGFNLTVPAPSYCINESFSCIVDLKIGETGLRLSNSWDAQVSGQNISFVLSGSAEFLEAPVAAGSYFMNFSSGSTSLLNGSSYTVSAADRSVNVSFYELNFDQTGLSNFNALWSIQLFHLGQSGSISTDFLGGSTDISFFVINGTYNFGLEAYYHPDGYYTSISFFDYISSVSVPVVSGSNLTVNITFFPKPGLYLVHFEVQFKGPGELFLQVYNQFIMNYVIIHFYASNNSQTINCLFENQSIRVTCSNEGYSGTSYFYVDGSDLNISLNLTWLQYRTVVFSESGLPPGTSWYVSAEGHVHSSISNRVYFTFSNQSVSFIVNNTGLYYPSPARGCIELSSRSQLINITFSSLSNSSFGIVSRTVMATNAHVYRGLFQNYPEPSYQRSIQSNYFISNFLNGLIVSTNNASNVYFLHRSPVYFMGHQVNLSCFLYRYSSSSNSLISLTNPSVYYSIPSNHGELHLVGLSSNESCIYISDGNYLFMFSTVSLEPVACHVIGPPGFNASSMIIDRFSGKLYAVDSYTGGVEVIGLNGTNLDYISLSQLTGFQPNYPDYLVCVPDSEYIIIHYGPNSFVYLNTEYNIFGGTFAVDYSAVAATFIPNTGEIAVVGYLTSENGTVEYRLSLINANTFNFIVNTSLFSLPTGIIFDPLNKMLYVSEVSISDTPHEKGDFLFTTGHVTVINPLRISNVVSNISVGDFPVSLSETANGTTIFIQNYGSGNLVVINVSSGSAISLSYPGEGILSGMIIAASFVAGAAVGYLWLYGRHGTRKSPKS